MMIACCPPVAFARRLKSLFPGLCLLLLPIFCLSVKAQPAGTVLAWGNNSDSQLQPPPGLGSAVAVAAGNVHSLALKSDGTVAGWGFDLSGQATPPPGLSGVTAIAAGLSYSMALKSDGSVVVWGEQDLAPSDLTNAIAIAAGATHALALRADGTVTSWGSQTDVPPGLTNLISVAAGRDYSLALRSDGVVLAWGDNSFGKTNVPAGATNVGMISAGQDHCLALKRDGTVVAWGRNDAGQTTLPPGLTNIAAVSAGGAHSVALRGNGTLIAWGDNTFGQANAPGTTNFFVISAGGSHNLALRATGAPAILVQPASTSAIISRSASFQVLAAGTPSLNYYWRKNGTNLPGASASSLTLNNVQASDAGAYSVLVSNSLGTALSSDAILTPVGLVPFVTLNPLDTNAICGEDAGFRGTGDGSTPLTFRWQFEGSPIAGATRTSLLLTNISASSAGNYTLVIGNAFGSITSAPGVLTVQVVPPAITSPLTANGKQGQPFSYTIRGLHRPSSYGAVGLPPGLSLNTTNGRISGSPTVSGTFGPSIYTFNNCTSAVATLVMTFTSSIPVITSPLVVSGTEGATLSYQITGSDSPTNFGAQNLPLGLIFDSATGVISGKPIYAGDFYSTIFASNIWGFGSATLHFTITNGPITGLSITAVETNYSSPYLLDFQFSLKDNDDPTVADGVVVDPRLLSVVCKEDGQAVSTSETAVIVERANMKQFKTVLALDFTESIASLANGDSNGDGISDAVDAIVAGAQDFVDQQRPGAQVGVYEFHREDISPQRVVALTTDHALLDSQIAGIWTNYVQWFPAASRAWDALVASIGDLGASNRDEQHFVVFVSDGKDESSISTVSDVIKSATNGAVRIFCIGFGAELDPVPLQTITGATQGKYYDAQALGGITEAFDQIGKDLNGRYLLRWATLKRSTNSFMPSFQISYQGFTAGSPTNAVTMDTNNPIVNTNTMPPTTNYPLLTNFVISPYTPSQHTGNVTIGSLRLVPNAAIQPSSVTLRAAYVPRYIRQIQIHYRANWPCTPVLQSTNSGEILFGWGLSETNDGAGGRWLLLSSPNPQSLGTSIPFGALGDLVQFQLRDAFNPTNAFSFFVVDNTIYTNTGNQSFTLDSTNNITLYPALPFGTPVPWLIAHGFTNNFAAAELSDPDGDGVPTWQEYQANTDPRDPNSAFVIRSVAQGFDGRYRVTFSTSVNRTYRVEASLDLVNWQLLQDNIPGIGADVIVTDTRYIPGANQMFYRVSVF